MSNFDSFKCCQPCGRLTSQKVFQVSLGEFNRAFQRILEKRMKKNQRKRAWEAAKLAGRRGQRALSVSQVSTGNIHYWVA